jgi:hypothetical protein
MTLGASTGAFARSSPKSVAGADEDPVLAVGQGHDLLAGPAAEAELMDVRAVVARGSQ